MKLIAKGSFPNATIVADRFHVQKIMNEAISDLRVDHRWNAIDQENNEMKLAKEVGRRYIPHTFSNGDTRRQLLARSRHIVLKNNSKWTTSQKQRAEILFEQYPDILEAYKIVSKCTAFGTAFKRKNANNLINKLLAFYSVLGAGIEPARALMPTGF